LALLRARRLLSVNGSNSDRSRARIARRSDDSRFCRSGVHPEGLRLDRSGASDRPCNARPQGCVGDDRPRGRGMRAVSPTSIAFVRRWPSAAPRSRSCTLSISWTGPATQPIGGTPQSPGPGSTEGRRWHPIVRAPGRRRPCSGTPALWGLRGSYRSDARAPPVGPMPGLDQGQEPERAGCCTHLGMTAGGSQ